MGRRRPQLLHHFGQIAIADAVCAVPVHAQQDDRDRKATALEDRQQDSFSGSRPPYTAEVNATVRL
jgi:hypothetical protein